MEKKFIYKDPKKVNAIDAIEILDKGEVDSICETLISLGLYPSNIDWSKDIILNYINSTNSDIASAAITALGHLGRVAHNNDINKFINLINIVPLREELGGIIQDVTDDLLFFMSKS